MLGIKQLTQPQVSTGLSFSMSALLQTVKSATTDPLMRNRIVLGLTA